MDLSSFSAGFDLSDIMHDISDFVDSYRDNLDTSCNWVRIYTGYTHYDGFCLVEDGEGNYDLDCLIFQEYQRGLQV